MPIDNHSQVEPYVVPCEMAMLRSATNDRDFVGSLFLGRYMANDIYAICSPAEIVASAFGSGATDLYFYGYNGLDDGGNFGKWGEPEKASLRGALDWFSAVRAVAGRESEDPPRRDPLSPRLLCALRAGHGYEDLPRLPRRPAGLCRQLADLGINADILHPSQVREGALEGYGCVVVPYDPHYWAMPDPELEAALRGYVEAGGTPLHSMADPVHRALGLEAAPHKADSFGWEEKSLRIPAVFVSYASGETQSAYLSDGAPASCHPPRRPGIVAFLWFPIRIRLRLPRTPARRPRILRRKITTRSPCSSGLRWIVSWPRVGFRQSLTRRGVRFLREGRAGNQPHACRRGSAPRRRRFHLRGIQRHAPAWQACGVFA